MSAKRLYIAVLLLAMGCQQVGVGQDNPALSDDIIDKPAAEVELERQLKIYKSTLFEGKSEQIRVEAATEILFNESPVAREILLDALKQTENGNARMAVCKVLIQARSAKESIPSKEDFVQPLLDVVYSEVSIEAQMAAEAMLIYGYDVVGESLSKIAADISTPISTRLNAIYALRLQPDKRAVIRLIRLVDDPDKQVSAAAERALIWLGIPAGTDSETRERIIMELEIKSNDEFLRDWLIRQQEQVRNLRAKVNLWQERYLTALGKIYDSIGDDAAKSKFLTEHLGSSESSVKLWALEKIRQDRVGTRPNPKLPTELGPILVNLISDQHPEVRLRTARILSIMGELNSAEQLLAQLKVEQDEQVKMELFAALGWACYFAFLPNSPVKISEQARNETLNWATEYLADQDSSKAQKGAEVMKRLLEQNGLESTEVDRYLDLLLARYSQAKSPSDGALRGELLSAMAGLCAPGSACRAKAAKLFGPLFENALSADVNRVREAAVVGLVYIDKAAALKRLRIESINDHSIMVRKKLIELAGEVGGREDLDWLMEKIGLNSEGEPAWQAMLRIFKRSEIDALKEWMARFDSESAQNRLSNDQLISFLEIVRQKAVNENIKDMLGSIRARLARLYAERGEFEQAMEYLQSVCEDAQTRDEKEAALSDLLILYLQLAKIQEAATIVKKCLLDRDLGSDSMIVRSIDEYLGKLSAPADGNVLLAALKKINVGGLETRPMWKEQLNRWTEHLAESQDTDSPGT